MSSNTRYRYIIQKGLDKEPEEHEKSAATILANHFKTNVIFIKRTALHTADLMIKGTIWEIKSPLGKGKHNIQHQFSRAKKQSYRIIIDSRRSNMRGTQLKQRCLRHFNDSQEAKGLIVISKTGKIILEKYKKK